MDIGLNIGVLINVNANVKFGVNVQILCVFCLNSVCAEVRTAYPTWH